MTVLRQVGAPASGEPAVPRGDVAIEVRDLRMRYGSTEVLNGVDFTAHRGEVIALLGPNGAGKTTTIKMLCGLLFPTRGTVTVGGYDLSTHGDVARRLISYVPDQPFLYEKLTGRVFLQFTCDLLLPFCIGTAQAK